MSKCPRCSTPLADSDDACPSCGLVVSRGEAPPGSAPAEREAAPEEPDSAAPAWERRGTLGIARALWETWRESVFRPIAFFRRLPPRAGIGPALSYALVAAAIALLFGLYWEGLQTILSGQESPVLVIVGSLVAFVFLLPLYVGFLFVMVAVIHLGFVIAGAGRLGYEATFRALAYSSGPALFAVFPFFGGYVSMVWGAVLGFIAVREVQRTTNGRATLGFLFPVAALFFLMILLGLLVGLMVGRLGTEATF